MTLAGIKMHIVNRSREKTQNCKRPNQAQGTLEITVALFAVLTILLCSINLFVWLNQRIVRRQREYEAGRVSSGSTSVIFQDESGYPKLDIFKGWQRWGKRK